jgi:hypothetical protein
MCFFYVFLLCVSKEVILNFRQAISINFYKCIDCIYREVFFKGFGPAAFGKV